MSIRGLINEAVAGPVVPVRREDLVDFVIKQSKETRHNVWVLLSRQEYEDIKLDFNNRGIDFSGHNCQEAPLEWILLEYRPGWNDIHVSWMPYNDSETEQYFNNPTYYPGYNIREVRSHNIFVDIIYSDPISIDSLI